MNCQNIKILDDACNQYTIKPTPPFASPVEIPPPPKIEHEAEPVSYTHLTLPTICSV